jgi:tetratricopeptide (TPR) repeat protein/transglutaminase-like putative cysteine protease
MTKPVLFLCAATAALLVGGHALAADTLQFGPAAPWVTPEAIPAGDKDASQGPLEILLEDFQVDFSDEGVTTYAEFAFRIANPQGMGAAQTVVAWNPEIDTPVVHKVHIIRDGKVIDVLADGQTFSTMRREANLERSMLDGVLTAVLQPEDVQVGDIINYSVSIRRKDPVMAGKTEAVIANLFPVEIDRVTFRARWPQSRSMRWRASSDLKTAKLTKSADGSTVAVAIDDFTPPKGPDRAPARFHQFTQMEYSQFASWAEVSALMAPLYVTAQTLTADSKLKAEAAKIRAASPDPKRQAAAALQLVQNKIRYVFLGLNQGGYVPAAADTTWTRRFGDCKGKTAVLLALLSELGIKAEPALVSTALGNGLDARLPMVSLFDHVIVRAEIGGKVYWLDGTRFGDRELDALIVPPYNWALPVRAKGGALEALKPVPLDTPQTEYFLKLDATAGLDAKAPAHAERIYRGDSAVQLNASLSAMSAKDADEGLKAMWKKEYSFIEVEKVGWAFDPTSGELRFTMDGKADMDWDAKSGSRSRHYEADGAHLGWKSKLERKDASDAPVMLEFPGYTRKREVILLPDGGKGFTVSGDAVDKTLAGYAFKRTVEIKDGAFVMEASSRALTPEIPYKEAVAATEPLGKLWDGDVYVRAPIDYNATDKDIAAVAEEKADTPKALVARGWQYLTRKKFDLARADFDAALKQDPDNARALVGRGYVKFYTDDNEGARRDIDAAAAIDPQESTIYSARAAIAEDSGDYPAALAAYTRALQIDPDNLFALEGRAGTYVQMDDMANALKDIDAKLKADPKSVSAHAKRAHILLMMRKPVEAEAALREAIALDPADDGLYGQLGMMLSMCTDGDFRACEARRTKAVEAYDKAIAIRPTAYVYAMRAQARPFSDKAGRKADVELAFKADPKAPIAFLTRGQLAMNDGDHDAAIKDFSAVLALEPDDTMALRRRAAAFEAKRNYDGEVADLRALTALEPSRPMAFNDLCWAHATHKRELEKGLEACNTAIKLSPLPQYYDSRALIYLQMGRHDEAIADYNVILSARPDLPMSLYPRGIAKVRKGLVKEGQAEIDKAKSLNSKVAERYAAYGVKP